MLDDVHRRHREAGAIDEAGDAAVELDVIQAELARFDFERRFLGEVAHLLNVLVAIERVVIEADLGVHGAKRFLAVRADHDAERIDLDHRGVAFPPSLVNPHEQLHTAVERVALEAERRMRSCAPDTA
jgi:hypothetical protein